MRKVFFRLVKLRSFLIWLANILTLPLNNLTKRHWNIIFQLLVGKYFWMIHFLVWRHSAGDINLFFNYVTKIDKTKNTKFAMEATEDVLEFLDLKLTFDKECKRISVDIFAKATNSSTYVLPSTCFTKTNTENFSNT